MIKQVKNGDTDVRTNMNLQLTVGAALLSENVDKANIELSLNLYFVRPIYFLYC